MNRIAITLLLGILFSCGGPADGDLPPTNQSPTGVVATERGTAGEVSGRTEPFVRIPETLEQGVPGGGAAFPLFDNSLVTVNPLAAADGVEQSTQRLWHGGLVRRALLGDRWETWLAKGFRFTDTALVIEIPDTLTWSDGQRLDAETWTRSVNEYYRDRTTGGPWREVLAPYGYEIRWFVSSATTLELSIEPQDTNARELLMRAAGVPPLPLHLLDPIRERYGSRAVVDAGRLIPPDRRAAPDYLDAWSWAFTGPYVPQSIDEGRLLLKRNAAYGLTDEAGVALPYLETLELYSVGDAAEALERFLNGELSLTQLAPGGAPDSGPDLRARLNGASIPAQVILGARAPQRLFYLGAEAPAADKIASLEEALWGDLIAGETEPAPAALPATVVPAEAPDTAPALLLIPDGVPVLALLAPLVAPPEYEIEVVAPEQYLTRLLTVESRGAALVFVDIPFPPRSVLPVTTGEAQEDLSPLLRPRLLVRDGLANVVPDLQPGPLWTGSADRIFWRGGVVQ